MNMQEVIRYQVEEEVEEIVAERVEQATRQVTEQVTQTVEQRMMKLTRQLLDAGRYEDLKRLTEDEEYRKALMKDIEE